MRLDVVGCLSDHQISDERPSGFWYEATAPGNSSALPRRDRDGLEALLLRLGPEVAEVGRGQHAGDDLDSAVLEGVDLRRVVAAAEGEPTGVDHGEPRRLQRRREPHVGIAPRVAVRVVGPEPAHDGAGLHLVPHAGEHLDDVLEAPEEVVVPFRGHGRLDVRPQLAADPEVVRLPWRVVGQHRDLVVRGLLDDGHGGVGRLGHEQHVDAFIGDELLRGGGGGVRVGLGVAVDDVDLVALALHHQAVLEQLPQTTEHERVRLAERGELDRSGV